MILFEVFLQLDKENFRNRLIVQGKYLNPFREFHTQILCSRKKGYLCFLKLLQPTALYLKTEVLNRILLRIHPVTISPRTSEETSG